MKSKTPRAGELSVSATAWRWRIEVQRKDAALFKPVSTSGSNMVGRETVEKK